MFVVTACARQYASSVGMREPTIPQRHVAAAESLRQVDQRQVRERRRRCRDPLMFCSVRARMRHAHVDVDRREHHVFVRHDAPRIAARRRRRDRREMRRRAHGRVPRQSSLRPSVRSARLSRSRRAASPPTRRRRSRRARRCRSRRNRCRPTRRARARAARRRCSRATPSIGPRDAGCACTACAADDAERSLADRTRDVAHQLRAVARLHEDQRVLGDRVLRVGHGARPEQILLLGDERRGRAERAAYRLPLGLPPASITPESVSPCHVAVRDLIPRAADEDGVAPDVRAGEVEHRFARAATDGARDAARCRKRSGRNPCDASPRNPAEAWSRGRHKHPNRRSVTAMNRGCTRRGREGRGRRAQGDGTWQENARETARAPALEPVAAGSASPRRERALHRA